MDAAIAKVCETGNCPVPLPIRNAPTQLMAELGYHDSYIYPHDFPHHFAVQQYLPDALKSEQFWHPADNLQEEKQRERLNNLWKNRKW